MLFGASWDEMLPSSSSPFVPFASLSKRRSRLEDDDDVDMTMSNTFRLELLTNLPLLLPRSFRLLLNKGIR